jgi:hypothetical protein
MKFAAEISEHVTLDHFNISKDVILVIKKFYTTNICHYKLHQPLPSETLCGILTPQRQNYRCNTAWRHIRLRDVEAPTFYKQSAQRWR